MDDLPRAVRRVPAANDVQAGYHLPCEPLRIGPAEVRLFRVPEGSSDVDRTVVCLPGLGASGRSFAPLRTLGRYFRFLFWTPPFATPRGISPLKHNLGLLAHPAGPLPQRFVLVGSSYGTLLAATFALQFPQRVRALVLVSPVLSTRRIRRSALLASSLLRVPLPFAYFFAPLVARTLGGPWLPPEGRAEIVREARRLSPVELARRLKDILSADLLPRLPELTIPTLLLHGGLDFIVPASAARDVQAHLPGARLALIPHAAHLPYMSHSTQFNALLGAFLAGVMARPAIDIPSPGARL